MADLLIYLVKVSVGMVLLYGLYLLLLKKDTHFSFNRSYLMISLIIPFIIPLFNIPINSGTTKTVFGSILQTVQVNSDNEIIPKDSMLSTYYFAIIYFTVLAILFIRFAARLISLKLLRHKCMIEKKDGVYIALCKKQIAPFSFLRTIFIEKKEMNDDQFDKIIMHEKVHIRQLHSIDILIAEILCMLTWFNPAGWKIKAALKETHEYLADSGVSEQTHDSAGYFMLLIKNAIGVQPGLANNFNKSLTLKRLNMMKKNRSGRLSRLKALLVLPVLAFLFMAFACSNSPGELKKANSNETQKNEKTTTTIDKMPEYPGGQEAMTKFILDNVKYPEAAKTAGIEGKVLVTFTVTKTGKLEKIRVTQKVNDLLDAEAIRVVSMMPDWIPGEDKGVAVDVEMTLPIAFKLK
jgi:TonB family protein